MQHLQLADRNRQEDDTLALRQRQHGGLRAARAGPLTHLSAQPAAVGTGAGGGAVAVEAPSARIA